MTLLEQENQKLELRPVLLGREQVCKNPDDVREVLRKRDELIRALEVKLTDITLEHEPALSSNKNSSKVWLGWPIVNICKFLLVFEATS